MRIGFTTGSCSAVTAKAATYMLLTGRRKESMSIVTPKKITYNADIINIEQTNEYVSCAVVKDGGDDPDVTSGTLIYATATLINDDSGDDSSAYVEIDGGIGVGRVTMPGLDQKVGVAAINSVPRQMIENEVLQVCNVCDYHGGIKIVISVPEGEKIAGNTFNPRLGIVGGISILGTSGVVEPMSSQALIDTIQVEMNQKKELGYNIIAITPGNYGLDFMKNEYQVDLDKSVKCSNFIGKTLDMAVELGFEKLILTGHIGKLVKVAGGIMNTHSKEGDCRMELLASAFILAGGDAPTAKSILECVTTEEGIKLAKEAGRMREMMSIIMDKIMCNLKRRVQDKITIECIIYSNQFGLLEKSSNAEQLLKEWKEI